MIQRKDWSTKKITVTSGPFLSLSISRVNSDLVISIQSSPSGKFFTISSFRSYSIPSSINFRRCDPYFRCSFSRIFKISPSNLICTFGSSKKLVASEERNVETTKDNRVQNLASLFHEVLEQIDCFYWWEQSVEKALRKHFTYIDNPRAVLKLR